MSRANRSSLLGDDSLGDSDASYSNYGSNGSSSSSGIGSTFRAWWNNPRKRLYMIAIIVAVLVFIAITVAYIIVSKEEDNPPTPPAPTPYNPETPWLYPRLPNTTIPSHYQLLEQINVADFQYGGHVNITVNITTPTDHIVLHAVGLTCYGVTLTMDNGTVLTPVAWQYERNQYLVLNFTSMLPVQRAAVIHVEFAATLREDIVAGLYASSYKNSTGQTVWMAVTQFAAIDARRAFPCFDEPALKSTFDLTIVSQPQWPTVLSNMPSTATQYRPDGWIVTVFDTTPIMSTYLVAFTVNDFVSTSAVSRCSSRDITTRVFAPPELVSWTNISTQIGAAVIAHYCQYFEMDYPLPKEDHFVVPQFYYSAMENWGLIAYRFDALLLQPGGYTVAQLQRVAQVVAHELAHQWFVWLNEGFASFVQYIGMEWAVPMLDARDQFLLQEESAAMAFDSNPAAHPVIDLTTTSGNFDRADYQKGASLLRMLEGILGPAVWLRGVNTYIQDFKYSNARSVDLFAHLTQAANESGLSINVADFMAPWTQIAGFPLVSCTTSSAADNMTQWQCAQKRYYANPLPANPDTSSSWNIYLTLANSPIAPIHWPSPQSTVTFTLPSTTAVKLNANETGYFRVMYDAAGWQQLSNALNADGFGGLSADDRLGVVLDAFVFARDERMSWATLLPLLQFLQYETNWPVWTSAAPSLLNLYKVMAAKTDGLAPLYAYYIQQQFARVAQSLNTSRFDTIRDRSLYTVLGDAIVRFDVGGRRQEFVDQFTRVQLTNGSLSALVADEVDLVLQSGVWSGGGLNHTSGAMYVFNQFYWPALQDGGFERVDPTAALSYNQLLRAMASSSNVDEIDMLIAMFAGNGTDRIPPVQDSVLMLQYLSQNDVARARVIQYVECCTSTLNSTLGTPLLGRVLYTLLVSQWDADQLTQLNTALDGKKPQLDTMVWDMVTAGRVVANQNVAYSSTVYDDISTYIKSMKWRNGS